MKVLVDPSVTETLVEDTTSDCVSLSASVPVTLTVVSPVDVTSNTAVLFARSTSCAAASVTVWAVFQLAEVNVRTRSATDGQICISRRPGHADGDVRCRLKGQFHGEGIGRPSVTETAVEDTTSDCVSLSASVPVTLTVVRPVDVTSNTAVLFARSTSCAAASVTVWAVFQLAV